MSENQIFKELLKKITDKYNVLIWNAEDDSSKDSHLKVMNYISRKELVLSGENQIVFYQNFGKEKTLIVIEDSKDKKVENNLQEIKKMHPSLDALIINHQKSLEHLTKNLNSFENC